MTNVFEALNTKAEEIGIAVITKAIEDRNVEVIRKIRDITEMAIQVAIDTIVNKLDHDTWFANTLKINVESDFNVLDTTGEFTKVVEAMKALDTREHYEKGIVPLFDNPVDELIAMRDVMIDAYNEMINDMMSDK